MVILCGIGSAAAGETPMTLGWIEWSWLEPGAIKIKTKLDTGAKTSSIDALDIEEFERDGKRWVRFRIPLARRTDDSDHGEDLVLERRVRRETMIKDHDSKSSKRYVVKLSMCIGGSRFSTEVNLADRSRFNYPLLLGRSALKHRALVDASRVFTAGEDHCEPPPE